MRTRHPTPDISSAFGRDSLKQMSSDRGFYKDMSCSSELLQRHAVDRRFLWLGALIREMALSGT